MNNKDDIRYLIGKNLKRLLKERHLTYKRFSFKCNYDEGYIKNVCSGTLGDGGLDFVEHCARVLNVDYEEFFKPINK